MIGVVILIAILWNFLHLIFLLLLRRRSKAAHLYMADFHFVLGVLRSHCKQSNHFHQRAKDASNNITKKNWRLIRTRIIIIIRIINAFAIMKSGRPFTDFELLIKLDKAKVVEVGNTYLNRKQGLELGLAIANVLRNNLPKILKQPYFLR